jgi:hypothetical protein
MQRSVRILRKQFRMTRGALVCRPMNVASVGKDHIAGSGAEDEFFGGAAGSRMKDKQKRGASTAQSEPAPVE